MFFLRGKCGSSVLCFSANCFTLFQNNLNSFSARIDSRVATQARETTWALTAVIWVLCNVWMSLSDMRKNQVSWIYAEAVRKCECIYTLMPRMRAFISEQEQFSSDQSHNFCNSSKFLITLLTQSAQTVHRVWQNNFMVEFLSPSANSPSLLLTLELFSTWMEWSLASSLGDIFTSFVSS